MDYADIHPIRTMGYLLLGIALVILVSYILYQLTVNTKKKPTNKTDGIRDSKTANEVVEEAAEPPKTGASKKNKIWIRIAISQFVVIAVLLGGLIAYYNATTSAEENLSVSSSEYVFGIDVSHYQRRINWSKMSTSHHPIEFVFIRSTMGIDGKDKRFQENWEKAKEYGYIRGAYHYYRPNEVSTQQFENFKSVVKLESGDFIPILDIEKESKYGRKRLRKGVLNWLRLAEKEYGVKPMVYTGLKFYQYVLKGHIDDYPIWIAAYSGKHRVKNTDWTFHQFTEHVRVKGIKTTVDGNDFNGNLEELKAMCK